MRLKRIYHIADIHIRNIKRHKEFREVFYSMFEEIKKRGTEDSIIYLAVVMVTLPVGRSLTLITLLVALLLTLSAVFSESV